MLRELDMKEMNAVAGGAVHDEVVSTGTINSGWDFDWASYWDYLDGAGGGGDPHGGLGVYGQWSGGGSSSATPPETPSADETITCTLGHARSHGIDNDLTFLTRGSTVGGVWTLYYTGILGVTTATNQISTTYHEAVGTYEGCPGH